jgi:hypothetical protein
MAEVLNLLDDAQEVGRLRATFEAAAEFGLADKEIWAIIMDVCTRTSRDLQGSDPLEELSAALATRILEYERRSAQAHH